MFKQSPVCQFTVKTFIIQQDNESQHDKGIDVNVYDRLAIKVSAVSTLANTFLCFPQHKYITHVSYRSEENVLMGSTLLRSFFPLLPWWRLPWQ